MLEIPLRKREGPLMKLATKILIVVVAGLLILYDIVAAIWGGPGATVSVVMLKWARHIPGIPYCFGILGAHLFWPSPRKSYRILRPILLGASGVLLVVVPLIWGWPPITPGIPMLAGVLMGHLLWNQTARKDPGGQEDPGKAP